MDKTANPQFVIGIDGYTRSKEIEDRLNSVFAAFFVADPAGAEVLDYLQAITMHAIVPATETPDRLRHQEGMRDLFRIIKERINKGKEGKNDSTSSGEGRGNIIKRRRLKAGNNPAS